MPMYSRELPHFTPRGVKDDAYQSLCSQASQEVASLARNVAGATPHLSKDFHENREKRKEHGTWPSSVSVANYE